MRFVDLCLSGTVGLTMGFQSFGLGIRIADQDPLATARGNAFVATADNPSAIYYNPAGIVQLEGHNIRGGFYGIALGSTYHSALTGTVTDTKDKLQGVPQLYYAYAPQDFPLAFGLGTYSPYGLSLEWPQSSGFRTLAIEGKIVYFTINPVVAWKITPDLSIAAGPTINISDARTRQGIAFPGDEVRFRGDDLAPGFNVGARWKLSDKLQAGASYRSATEMNFSGHSDIVNPFIPAPFFPPTGTEAANAKFQFPQNVILGLSWRPTPQWNIEFNYDWTDWDSLNQVTVRRTSGNLPSQAFDWRSSAFYELGATYRFQSGVHASAGYIFSENSVPTATFNPLVPDSDRHIFSAGVGGNWGKVTWDAAYQLAYGPTRTVSGGPSSFVGETVNGTYRFLSHAFTISFGYSF